MTILDERPTVSTATPPAGPLVSVRARGYYQVLETKETYTSVTTILGRNVSKPGLVPWAGNTVAKTALDNLPYLVKASRKLADAIEAYDWLRAAAERIRDARGDIGTAVHKLIEAKVLDTPLSPEVADDPEFAPYMAHFEAFVRDYQVTFTASEMIVVSTRYMYGGTLDFLFKSPVIAEMLHLDPGMEISGDTKTGGELDGKGVYPEAALQESAYGHADFAQLRDGTHTPMFPVADWGIVLHLRPEGYRVIPVCVDDRVFAAFLRLRENDAEWTTTLSKRVIGEHLTLPTKEVA
jgi:hypothetical protein